MYTRHVYATATRAGVSCLISFRCAAPCFCFRIRDPSIRLRFVSGGYLSRLVYEPFGAYANPGGSDTTRDWSCDDQAIVYDRTVSAGQCRFRIEMLCRLSATALGRHGSVFGGC